MELNFDLTFKLIEKQFKLNEEIRELIHNKKDTELDNEAIEDKKISR